MGSKIRIAIVGGAGFWANDGHLRNIHKAVVEEPNIDAKVVALVDPINPRLQSGERKEHLERILLTDDPLWVNTSSHNDISSIVKALKNMRVNLVIVASPPVYHAEYVLECIKNDINVVCDKPIISRKNASHDAKAASSISEDLDIICKEYVKSLSRNPRLLCVSILRRRGLSGFSKVAKELKSVHEASGAGINNMSIIVNSGKYLHPNELTLSGAHGYHDGIGSLSHSAYHYIDILSWYMSIAHGAAQYLRPRLSHVMRVHDYMESSSYKLTPLFKNSSAQIPQLSDSILKSELNTSYSIEILDKNLRLLGNILFTFNQLSYCPRTLPQLSNNLDPGNYSGGGRISNCIIDIHQGAMQNCYIYKNDTVFEPYTLNTKITKHPSLISNPGVTESNSSIVDPYENGHTLADAYKDLFNYLSDSKFQTIQSPVLRPLSEERMATDLYSNFYELLSNENSIREIRILNDARR